MQYLARMQIRNTVFSLPLTNESNRTSKYDEVKEDAKVLAQNLGAILVYVDSVPASPQGYQFTAHDEEFVYQVTQLEGGSERATDHYLREQIQIWHNDKPQATQTDFHTLYSLWLRALELRPGVEVIVDIVDGVLQVAKSNSDIVFHAIQRDRSEKITADQDALYERMDRMKGVF